MTILEWAQKKRGRAFQAMSKSPEDEHLREVFEHWKTIIKALRIMEEERNHGWTLCSQGLPKEEDWYQTTHLHKEPYLGNKRYVACDYFVKEYGFPESVVAWRPMLEPWGGRQDE